jgi:hypothetical protein
MASDSIEEKDKISKDENNKNEEKIDNNNIDTTKETIFQKIKAKKLSKKSIYIINGTVFLLLILVIGAAYYFKEQEIAKEEEELLKKSQEVQGLEDGVVKERVKVDLSIIDYDRVNSELAFLLEVDSNSSSPKRDMVQKTKVIKNSANNLKFDTSSDSKSIFVELMSLKELTQDSLDRFVDEEIIICKNDNQYKIYAGPFDNSDIAKDYINFILIDDASIITIPQKEFDNCNYHH